MWKFLGEREYKEKLSLVLAFLGFKRKEKKAQIFAFLKITLPLTLFVKIGFW
jgi:hypothetical protein